LIFKHAISTVVSGRAGMHLDSRPERAAESRGPAIAASHAASSAAASTGTEGPSVAADR
jgi:host factor-I protein